MYYGGLENSQCSLTRYFFLVYFAKRGSRRLQGIIRGDGGLQGVTGGVQEMTGGYKGLHGVTAGYRGLQRITENLISNWNVPRYFLLVYFA